MLEFLWGLFFIRRDVDEIIPGLWLGNYKSALDVDFLLNNNIDVIINCTQHIPFVNQLELNIDDIETYRIPVNDSLLECDFLLMQDYFKIIIPLLLRKYTIEKKKILIHCHSGKQRSAILTAALLKVLIDKNYITLQKELTLSKESTVPKGKKQFQYICNYILSKRPQVFTYGLRINFEPTYKRFFKIY